MGPRLQATNLMSKSPQAALVWWIWEVQDSLIGSDVVRGISGGQRPLGGRHPWRRGLLLKLARCPLSPPLPRAAQFLDAHSPPLCCPSQLRRFLNQYTSHNVPRPLELCAGPLCLRRRVSLACGLATGAWNLRCLLFSSTALSFDRLLYLGAASRRRSSFAMSRRRASPASVILGES